MEHTTTEWHPQDEITRLSALCDKWNFECDQMREDNKRLAKELEAAKAEIETHRQKFGGSEPLDIEAIRQSPRQYVDLETVEKLGDYAMCLELKIERLEQQLAEAQEALDLQEEKEKK